MPPLKNSVMLSPEYVAVEQNAPKPVIDKALDALSTKRGIDKR